MDGPIQYLSFGDWLISPSIVSSRFIHIVPYVRIVFSFKAEQYSIDYFCNWQNILIEKQQ